MVFVIQIISRYYYITIHRSFYLLFIVQLLIIMLNINVVFGCIKYPPKIIDYSNFPDLRNKLTIWTAQNVKCKGVKVIVLF